MSATDDAGGFGCVDTLDGFGGVYTTSRVRLVLDGEVDGERWVPTRDALNRTQFIPATFARHEREWRQFQAREAVDVRPYAPLRAAWEVMGKL